MIFVGINTTINICHNCAPREERVNIGRKDFDLDKIEREYSSLVGRVVKISKHGGIFSYL